MSARQKVTPGGTRIITWAGGSPIHRAPLALARRFVQICTSVVAEALADQDLTPLEYALLQNLDDDPDVDQIGIAARLGIDRNSTGVLIRRMEQRGLVRRQTNGADRRARLVHLTPKGYQLRERARPLIAAQQQQILSVLPAVDRERFLDQLVLVIKANEAHARPGAGRRRRGDRSSPYQQP
jgi:DNA-binding MarR family transcriptional regulator